MKKGKLIVSVVLSTLIFTAWSFISWTILPFHSKSLENLNNNVVDITQMQKSMPSGIYHYPGLPADNSKESWDKIEEQLKAGPRITLMVYSNEGSSLFDLKSFTLNILFNIITSVLLVVTVMLSANKKASTIITLVLLAALIVCFSKSLPFLIWFKFPTPFVLPDLLDTLVSFSLVAIVLSYIHKVKHYEA